MIREFPPERQQDFLASVWLCSPEKTDQYNYRVALDDNAEIMDLEEV